MREAIKGIALAIIAGILLAPFTVPDLMKAPGWKWLENSYVSHMAALLFGAMLGAYVANLVQLIRGARKSRSVPSANERAEAISLKARQTAREIKSKELSNMDLPRCQHGIRRVFTVLHEAGFDTPALPNRQREEFVVAQFLDSVADEIERGGLAAGKAVSRELAERYDITRG